MTCNFKRPSLRLFKLHNLSPFGLKSAKSLENMKKGDRKEHFKYKSPETRAFKGTYYLTKILVLMGEPLQVFF